MVGERWPHCGGVRACPGCHLVKHALDSEFGVTGADSPPKANIEPAVYADIFTQKSGNVVIEIDSLGDRGVQSTHFFELVRVVTRRDRICDDAMMPSNNLPSPIDTDPYELGFKRTIFSHVAYRPRGSK